MRMVREEIVAYLREWEAGTLDTIESWAERDATRFSFYGRNTPRGRTGTCDPDHVETWSIAGYGSTAAILDMAVRHGREGALRWLGRNVAAAIEIVPQWLAAFGKPPGEDAWLPGLCGHTMAEVIAGGHGGDTDILRHWNGYGLLVAGHHPEVLRAATDETRDVIEGGLEGLAEQLFQWILGHRQGVVEHPRDYLRYGNDLDGLCGIYRLFAARGLTARAAQVYNVLATYIRWIFQPRYQVQTMNPDGDIWRDWNYGHMEPRGDHCVEPFSYGYYPLGMQAWYRGHLLVGLIHAEAIARERNDGALRGVILNVIHAYTRWIDPTLRHRAPVAPGAADGSARFHNSELGGGFLDPERRLLPEGAVDTTLDEWARVGEDQPFRRYAWFCDGIGGWCVDGDYWSSEYVDPLGLSHPRKHSSARPPLCYEPRLPGLETDNGYACLDGIFARAVLTNDPVLREFARILVFQRLAFCHTSDTVVRLSKRLRRGVIEGANLIGQPGRAFHWAVQSGWILRSVELSKHQA